MLQTNETSLPSIRLHAGWLKIDVGALSDAREGTWFPVAAAAPAIPFATDVTGGAASI